MGNAPPFYSLPSRMSINPSPSLRLHMRQQRRAIPSQQRQHAALSLLSELFHHPLFKRAKHIACYLDNDGEISLNLVIQYLWKTRKHCYLPALHPQKTGLYFLPYTADTCLRNNRFGIAEPCALSTARPPWALDLVLMPLVAFDQLGHRLGMGGGFYDASFAYLKQRQHPRPHLLGVAFECQHLPQLPHINSWDIPLQGAVTECGSYTFEAQSS